MVQREVPCNVFGFVLIPTPSSASYLPWNGS